MAKMIEIDDQLWAQVVDLCARNQIQDAEKFATKLLQQQLKYESMAEGRYIPVAGVVVRRAPNEILLVGNEYKRGMLTWTLPGGAVEPGEDYRSGAVRELREETGLQLLAIGRLLWISQIYYGPDKTGLIAFAFEATAWEGELSQDYEEVGGDVRTAEFVSEEEALARLINGQATPLRDWLAAPATTPRVYWRDVRQASAVQLIHE